MSEDPRDKALVVEDGDTPGFNQLSQSMLNNPDCAIFTPPSKGTLRGEIENSSNAPSPQKIGIIVPSKQAKSESGENNENFAVDVAKQLIQSYKQQAQFKQQ